MKKPELKEIADHMNNQQEALLFYNYYESQGWKVGKNPMKSWKSAASGWLSRNKKRELKTQSKVDQAVANTGTKLIDLLWVRMTEIYGHKWVTSYGTTPSKPWTEVINNLGQENIKHGLSEILKNGENWPPSLTEFNKMCRSYRRPIKSLNHLPGRKEILQIREKTQQTRESEINKIRELL